ncbi:hypothetical protein Tco_1514528 [Tanacetum coccineum]
MDGRGVGSCVMLGSAPSCLSFSVSPSVKLLVAGRGGAGKGGSCVLIPDLVVMAKVDALGSGVSLLCLLQTSIPAQMGCSAHIHQPRGLLRSNHKLGCIASEMEETFMEGDGSSQRSSWYWTYSSILFYLSSSVRELKWNWVIGFWKPEELGRECSCKVLEGVGSLAPVLLEEDASSSKRFLPAIARDSF